MAKRAVRKIKDLITDTMLKNLRATFPQDITGLSITENVGSGQAREGHRYANLNLLGVNSDFRLANDLTILGGHFLLQDETDSFKKVAVVSDKLASNMFGRDNPLGRTIDIVINNISERYTIVGTYEYVANEMNPTTSSEKDLSTTVFIPLQTALHRTGSLGLPERHHRGRTQHRLHIICQDNRVFFQHLLCQQQRLYNPCLQHGKYDGHREYYAEYDHDCDFPDCSHFVACRRHRGHEYHAGLDYRTDREIGTRKALGATNASIRIQFIVESVIICLFGGAIGILLGILLGMIGAYFMGFPAKASFANIALAVGFSMAIGNLLRLLPSQQSRQNGSDRSSAIRVKTCQYIHSGLDSTGITREVFYAQH